MSAETLGALSEKATPGEWCVEDPMDFELTIVEAGKETYEWRAIASCSLPDGDDDQDFTSGEIQANAALIAASVNLVRRMLSTDHGRKAIEEHGG